MKCCHTPNLQRIGIPAFVLLSLSGCRQQESLKLSAAPEPSQPDVLSVISEELSLLSDTMSVKAFLLLLMLVLAAISTLFVLSRVMRRLKRRYRLDTPEVKVLTLLGGVSLVGFAFVAFFNYLSDRTPLLTSVGAAAVFASLAFYVVQRAPSWATGFALVVRRSLREGDMIRVGDIQGEVDQIGFLRLVLLDAEGARVHLSLSSLGRTAITVSSPTKEHFVEYLHRHEGQFSEQMLTQIRNVAVLSPYRIVSSRVRVDVSSQNPAGARIRFQTWSEEAKDLALLHLRRSLDNL